MAYDNIQFESPYIIIVGGYFYEFYTEEEASSPTVLLQKVSNGDVSFTYPILDNVGTNAIKCASYDGLFIWTMQDGTVAGSDLAFKKWVIDKNGLVHKENEINLVGDVSNKYDSTSFALEQYNTTFSSDVPYNQSYVCLTEYADTFAEPGVVLNLGPNSDGEYESVTVTGTISGDVVGLNFYTLYAYETGDAINFNKAIWLFNDYNGVETVGALYKLDPITGAIDDRFDDSEYKGITASTFSKVSSNVNIGTVHSLMYADGNLIKFLNVHGSGISVYCIMTIDNLKIDGITVIDIYGLAVYNDHLYRLQNEAMFYGSDYSWGIGEFARYNYVLSPIRNFVDSITLSVYPNILPSMGMGTAKLTAVVNDQYSEPIYYKPVYFSDDDTYGFITLPVVYTNINGVAISNYNAGLTAGVVTLEALFTQFD